MLESGRGNFIKMDNAIVYTNVTIEGPIPETTVA